MATSRSELSDCVKSLLENDESTFVKAAGVLVKISKNILHNPGDEKYRKLRISNKTVSDLLTVCGGFQCLFDMGFEEADEFLILPKQASLDRMRNINNQLEHELDKKQTQQVTAQGNAALSSASIHSSQDRIPLGQNVMLSEAEFYHRISAAMKKVRQYELPEAQRQALNHIPLERLNANVQKKMEAIDPQSGVGSKDLLLLELLAWFKNEFFQWMNSPKCRTCHGDTQAIGNTTPGPEELKYGADRVESYLCKSCNVNTLFPRYNDPVKLLSTRTGRCGEWANCFTLCCRAVGFEARFVLDWTDHVWTEVYSEKQQRWLHCDPCENVCDKPLLYEVGWNKKLSYVLAFCKDDIQDVTWRYSAKHKEVLSRRTLCRESWLLNLILKLRKQLQERLPPERQTELKHRLLVELVEFLSVKSASDGEMSGRTSGSLAWRVARGEISGQTASIAKHIIKPTAVDLKTKEIHIQYCCASDTYTRGDGSTVTGWQKLVYEGENIFRKEETDWKMVYLARTEGTDTASITWKIDLQGSGFLVDSMDIQALSTCYENGHISWRVCADEQCAILPSDGKLTSVDSISGSSVITITATLTQGRGSVAWQHTQLFRQSIDDTSNPLDIKIHLRLA